MKELVEQICDLLKNSSYGDEMIDYYSQGYWSCGLLSDGRVVVY